MKHKILFVLEHFHPHVGGVETEFWEFANRIACAGCEVRVVTSDSGGVRGEVNHGRFFGYHYPWPVMFGHPRPRAADLSAHVTWADLIHTTTYTAARPALSAARAAKKPCLLTVQEALRSRWFKVISNPLLAGAFMLFERWVITGSFDHWHAISEATRGDVAALGVPDERLKMIHLGIDGSALAAVQPDNPALLFGFDPGDRVVLYFGRAGKTKGLPLLIDALCGIRRKLPADVRFGFIVGAHPAGERARLEQTVRDKGLSDIVRFSPSLPRAKLLSAIKGAYAVVTPSLTEGFGFSAAETCALGTPIVSSDAGSLPEVVSGRHLFFRSGDALDLGSRILEACAGGFLTESPKLFSWDRAAEELLSLYGSIITAWKTRRC